MRKELSVVSSSKWSSPVQFLLYCTTVWYLRHGFEKLPAMVVSFLTSIIS